MTTDVSALNQVRTVADAVLYEGYLLYPYRSTSAKNQVRWQFGVLGPPKAAAAGLGEEPDLAIQCLLSPARDGDGARISIHLRFLHLQARDVQRATPTPTPTPALTPPSPSGGDHAFPVVPSTGTGRSDPSGDFTPVRELTAADGRTWLSWDEAVECELAFGPFDVSAGHSDEHPVEVAGGEDVELLHGPSGDVLGRIVRRREPISGVLSVRVDPAAPSAGPAALLRLGIGVRNTVTGPFPSRDTATARSMLGAHLVLVADGASFVSVIDPPDSAREAAAGCAQHRCWPVLAGTPDGDGGATDMVLASPIILYDFPAVAPESHEALFDSTEIDEILMLRVMTLTDEEKAAARATDPHAAAIIDRCDQLTPEELQSLHGILRDPRSGSGAFRPFSEKEPTDSPGSGAPSRTRAPDIDIPTWSTPSDSTVPVSDSDVPWWDPGADASVEPSTDAVLVQGVEVRRDSRVRLRPNRRADAQDLFFAGQEARVTAVLSDVDGATHVAVVLVHDPAADLHDWYGRYLYFAPEELEPLQPRSQ